MNNNEIWSYWIPANIEKSDYNLYSLCEIGLDLIIILLDFERKDQELHIIFRRARCFRRTNEVYTIARMRDAYDKQTRAFFWRDNFIKWHILNIYDLHQNSLTV